MLVGLAGLYFLLKPLNLNNKTALGYALPKRQFIFNVMSGIGLGILIMVPLFVCLFLLDIRLFKSDIALNLTDWISILFKVLLSGVLIGLIEETFFRGALYSAINRHSGLWSAIVLSSLLYALLHFVDTDLKIPEEELNWFSGLLLLSHSFEQFLDPGKIFDSFIALIFVGVFLTLVRVGSKGIALCIGIHAGWVVTIKTVKKISYTDTNASFAYLVGDYDHVIGMLATIWLVFLSIITYFIVVRKGSIANPYETET